MSDGASPQPEMTPERWHQIRDLLADAIRLPPKDRLEYVAKVCGNDPATQAELESLIAAHEIAEGGAFDKSALDMVALPGVDWNRARFEAHTAEVQDPMVGRRLGAYKLVKRIGQGGMAAVFLAVRADDEYKKEVAIKLVQPGLYSPELLERFRNERQTLAGLDHPNIVKLLDGGTTPEGLPFLVMDYVEGSPIDDYCDGLKLTIDERLRLFSKICEAVHHAHQKGIVHRDLKPSNILVIADGTPKLLDFGIAKVLAPTTGTPLVTHTRTQCMTPAYASPEQVRGKAVTAATDIYSMGVVLYELLTGHRPYRLKEHTPAEMERATCEQEPEAPSTAVRRVESETSSHGPAVTKTAHLVSETREGHPEKLRRRLRGDLDNILLKALCKEPGRRYGSIQEFAQDIDRHLKHSPVTARPSSFGYRATRFAQRHKTEVVTGVVGVFVLAAAAAVVTLDAMRVRERPTGGTPRIQSVAVLPFANLSGDPAQEYFSDGMTDALITDLSQIGSVKVISRTSSMQYKQTKKSLPEIARELHVDGIVEGTVQHSGDRIRITAQLVQGATDHHLWAKSYERDAGEAFVLERDLTQDITHEIQARLTVAEQRTVVPPRTPNPKALEAYRQGLYHRQRFGHGYGDEEERKAASYLREAIQADPDFVPAYIESVNAHYLLWPDKGDLAAMLTAAEKAVALEPASADAHVALGDAKWASGAWAESEQQFRQAVALNPNSDKAHASLGNILQVLGDANGGWNEEEIAQELNPKDDALGWSLYLQGHYDDVIEQTLKYPETDPSSAAGHWSRGQVYLQKRMYEEWATEIGIAMKLYGFPEVAGHLQHALATDGPKGAMRQWARDLERLNDNKQIYYPGVLAQIYCVMGDNDRAFFWLEHAYAHRDQAYDDPYLWGTLRIDPGFATLRSDPRYKDLMHRIGLPP